MRVSLYGAKLVLVYACAAAALYGCGKGSPGDNAARPQAGGQPAKATAKMEGDPAAGKDIYARYCHYCHGSKGFGDGPVGIAITPHPADFVHDAKRMSKTDEELYKSITEGVRRDVGGDEMAMPRWKEVLTEKERWDALAYVRQLEREGRKEEAASKGR